MVSRIHALSVEHRELQGRGTPDLDILSPHAVRSDWSQSIGCRIARFRRRRETVRRGLRIGATPRVI
jgi:hypothetical protein